MLYYLVVIDPLFLLFWEEFNSSAQLFCPANTDERKIVGKLQILANMKLICWGRQKSLRSWDGIAQFYWTNFNKSAGRITGLHSSISASFRFTRQSIYCIGQAGLRVGRFARQNKNIHDQTPPLAPSKLPHLWHNLIFNNSNIFMSISHSKDSFSYLEWG